MALQKSLGSIAKLFSDAGINFNGKIEEIKDSGWVNLSFFVDDRFVIRFNARDPELPKFQREVIAYSLLCREGIPVPKVIYTDFSHGRCPYDVIILSRCPGTDIEKVWPDLSSITKKRISIEAGKMLARIHNISPDYYGEIANTGPLPRRGNWKSFLSAYLLYLFDKLERYKVFTPKEIKFIEKVLKSSITVISTVQRASLLHGCFHPGNVIMQNKIITAVIDLEWSISGDAVYDLTFTGLVNWSEDHFFQGYNKIRPLKEKDFRKLEIYQIIKNLNLCFVSKVHYTKKEAQENKTLVIDQVKDLNGK